MENLPEAPYWIKATLASLGPPPKAKPQTRFSTIMQAIGLFSAASQPSPSTSLVGRALENVFEKRIVLVSLVDGGTDEQATLIRKHISLDPKQENGDVDTQVPFIAMNIANVFHPQSGNVFHGIHVGLCRPRSFHTCERAICSYGDAIICVLDGNRDTFIEAMEELQGCLNASVKTNLGKDDKDSDAAGQHDKMQTSPVAILVNAHVKESSMTAAEVRGKFDPAIESNSQRSWGVFDVSVETGEGVSEAIKWMAVQLQGRVRAVQADEKAPLAEEQELEGQHMET